MAFLRLCALLVEEISFPGYAVLFQADMGLKYYFFSEKHAYQILLTDKA